MASGLSLEAQPAAVTAAAGRFSLVLDGVFVDAGTSGSLSVADRPVLMEAIVALKRGDVLLVAKRDRLGRDVYEVLGIQRLIATRGARVVSAAWEGTDADSPSDVLMRGLIDQFAHSSGWTVS